RRGDAEDGEEPGQDRRGVDELVAGGLQRVGEDQPQSVGGEVAPDVGRQLPFGLVVTSHESGVEALRPAHRPSPRASQTLSFAVIGSSVVETSPSWSPARAILARPAGHSSTGAGDNAEMTTFSDPVLT